MRVAVLQTDPSYRNLISDVVKRLGHTCVTFGDGLVLSKALSRSTVDLLILDWNSTGLCGLDLLKSVRSSFGERVPVMFATPDGAEHNIVCALTMLCSAPSGVANITGTRSPKLERTDLSKSRPQRPVEFQSRISKSTVERE